MYGVCTLNSFLINLTIKSDKIVYNKMLYNNHGNKITFHNCDVLYGVVNR